MNDWKKHYYVYELNIHERMAKIKSQIEDACSMPATSVEQRSRIDHMLQIMGHVVTRSKLWIIADHPRQARDFADKINARGNYVYVGHSECIRGLDGATVICVGPAESQFVSEIFCTLRGRRNIDYWRIYEW